MLHGHIAKTDVKTNLKAYNRGLLHFVMWQWWKQSQIKVRQGVRAHELDRHDKYRVTVYSGRMIR